RSDLGGIASKIGQLYFNFWLRSGDTGALLESYTFYDAIHTRQYFGSAAEVADPAAATRQLRFYARFAVVCLLLNRKEEAMQLLQELQASVSAYQLQFAAPDSQDWQLVVNEVTALMAADVAMPLPRSPGSLDTPFKPPVRCRPTGPAASCAPHRPHLREALLVSYRPRQAKDGSARSPRSLYMGKCLARKKAWVVLADAMPLLGLWGGVASGGGWGRGRQTAGGV
ncbi:Protein SCAI, partial [Tetrabaena socialis]